MNEINTCLYVCGFYFPCILIRNYLFLYDLFNPAALLTFLFSIFFYFLVGGIMSDEVLGSAPALLAEIDHCNAVIATRKAKQDGLVAELHALLKTK